MADSKITELPVAAALSGAESFYGLNGTSDTKISPIQFTQYVVENYAYDTTNSNTNTIAGAINELNAIGTDTRQLLLSMHPVGSLYWSSKNESPASKFGGTWTQITDKFILAAGDTYAAGGSGGEATHTLTVAEMPSHDHGGKTGGPNDNTSDGSSASSTGGVSANHTHSIVSLSGTAAANGSHTHRLSYGGNETTSGEGLAHMSGTSGTAKFTTSKDGAHTHPVTITGGTTGNNSVSHTHTIAHTHTLSNHTHSISSQGSGSAHNNMPPYVAKYCWERTE